MVNTKILVAGPGTGKTTKIKEIFTSYGSPAKVLILSFTNATVLDLLGEFKKCNLPIDGESCLTLHKFALKINHLLNFHILNDTEKDILLDLAKRLAVTPQILMESLSTITFDMMIDSSSDFIKNNAIYAREKIGELDLLIIDEYQDFNDRERRFIQTISHYAKNTFILGDDDQCIYGFKDADVDGIISAYNNTQTERVPHDNVCYRCPDDIVKACNNLIRNNKKRIDKELKISNKSGTVLLEQLADETNTAGFVASKIKQLMNSDSRSAIMILSPVSFAVEQVIQEFNKQKIEFINWFSPKLSAEDQKKIWILRVLGGSKRLLNMLFLSYEFRTSKKTKFKKFIEIVREKIQNGLGETVAEQKVIELGLLNEGYMDSVKNQVNIADFIKQNTEYHHFIPFFDGNSNVQIILERLETFLTRNFDNDPSKVKIMSIHKSKGLQADYVFIVGLVDGILPNGGRGIDSIEAQRRVFFVGMSRAKKQLFLISTVYWNGKYVHKVDKSRFKYDYRKKAYKGQTSLFVRELKLE